MVDVRGHVTTEGTAKALKAQLVACYVLLLAGVVAVLAWRGQPMGSYGGMACLAGVVWLGVTKIRIWWDHA